MCLRPAVKFKAWQMCCQVKRNQRSKVSVKFKEESMKKMKDRMMQFLMLGLLGISFAFSVGQLTIKAQTQPACAGLQCTAQEDCGSKCFCNRPSGGCFSDSGDVILD